MKEDIGERLAKEAMFREFARTGKLAWSVYFRVLLEWDQLWAEAQYQDHLRRIAASPPREG